MKILRIRTVGVYWLGGGGGGGNPQQDAGTQFQFNEQAARLGRELNKFNVDSPQGTTTFRGNTLIERLSPRGKQIFNIREQTDKALAENARRQAGEANQYATQNAGRLSDLRQSELGAAESRSGIRSKLLGDIGSQGTFNPDPTFAAQGVSDLSNVDRYGEREQDLGRKSVEDALYSRLNPQFDRDRGALESRLAAQGIEPGSEQYKQGMDELNRSNTDARYQATLAGGQEQSRLEGLRQNELQRRRGTRQQLLEEALSKRGVPYNELQNIEA